MINLKELGVMDYYYLDGDKIYNERTKEYVNETSEYRYRLNTINGNRKSITMKYIYKQLFNEVFCIDDIERLEGEVFKTIADTDGLYLASNMGRIISYCGNHAILLKPHLSEKGYQRLQLSINGKKINKFVHTLIANTWLTPPNGIDYDIHHIKDKTDNRAESLMYVSKIEHIKLHKENKKNA